MSDPRVPTPGEDSDQEAPQDGAISEADGVDEASGPDGVGLPGPVEAALEELPEEQREKVRSTFLGLSQFTGPLPHPLLGKMTEEHLDKLIDGAERDNQRSYDDRKDRRNHVRFLAAAGMAVFLLASALFLWMNQTELLETLIQIAMVFAGGIGVGAGFLKPRP